VKITLQNGRFEKAILKKLKAQRMKAERAINKISPFIAHYSPFLGSRSSVLKMLKAQR